MGSLVDNRRNINSDKWRIYRVGIYSLGNTVSIENKSISMVNQIVTPFNPRASIKLGQLIGLIEFQIKDSLHIILRMPKILKKPICLKSVDSVFLRRYYLFF